MIIVFGGTVDARNIVERLAAEALPVKLHALTAYGASLAGAHAQAGALSGTQLEDAVANAWMVIDATHPYAVKISQEARDAAQKYSKKYLRYERQESLIAADVLRAATHDGAAALACEICNTGSIFLTVGTRALKPYVAAARAGQKKIFARILPVEESLRAASQAGLAPAEIVAMQGPVDVALERAFLKFCKADVLVTKDSGAEGGTAAKFEAARCENVRVVVVERPKLDYPWQTSDLETLMGEVHRIVRARG